MKINDRPASCRNQTPLVLVSAFVLLVGVVNAITFGVLHSHDSISTTKTDTASASASILEQAGLSACATHHGQSGADSCLTCLLHQQLFTSTVTTPFLGRASSQVTIFNGTDTVFYYPRLITFNLSRRFSGRAPPSL